MSAPSVLRDGPTVKGQSHLAPGGADASEHELLLAVGFVYHRVKTLEARLRKPAKPGRRRSIAALQAAIDFFESFEELRKDDLIAPLVELADALLQVEEGRKHPLLMPVTQGRQQDPTPHAIVKAYAAAALQLQMKVAPSKRVAAQKVADALTKAGCRLTSPRADRPIKPGTVASWRDNLTEAITPHYHRALKVLRAARVTAQLSDEEIADHATGALMAFVQKHRLSRI